MSCVGMYYESSEETEYYEDGCGATYSKTENVEYAEFYLTDNIWISVDYNEKGNPTDIRLKFKNTNGRIEWKTIKF
jgi:hypothetical protein